MLHNCKNLLIRCMDFRLNNEVDRWTKESDLFKGGFDVVSVAGASKNLADGSEEIKNSFLKNIAVSVDLHQAERIIIFHHSDCGAYAQSYDFNFLKKEKEKQIEDMKKAREIILEKYPKVEIVLVWGEMKDEQGREVEFEVIVK
ncbi:MAG: carbonic anhydrase [Patescibacteria group bacterium]|nr:carbonic anhydrase [Patescibacteria group bacterium]